MKNTLIPIGSFCLAVAMALLSGSGTRFVVARQSGGTTGCECKFDIMSQTGTVGWTTESPSSPVLTSIFLQNSVTVCTSSEPQGLSWTAEWKATNLKVAYTVEVKGFVPIIEVQVIPIKYGSVSGKCPCKPATDTKSTMHIHLSALTKGAEDAVRALVAPKFPPGTKIDPKITAISLAASLDNTVSGSNGCGAKSGPFTLSIPTYTTPKNASSGLKDGNATYKSSCP